MQRQPLGDGTVHIGGPDIVANAGRIELGGPAQGPTGEMRMADPASEPLPFPPTPGLDDNGNFHVTVIPPNYDGVYPYNGGERAWKGADGGDGYPDDFGAF